MLTGFLNRWKREQDGVAAMEFAFLGIPFFMFIIGIIEVALMMANASIMEGAVYDAARQIRTGQVQQDGDPEAAFRAAICDHAIIMDCDGFEYYVTTLNNFSDADENLPEFDEEGSMEDQDFSAGGSGDVVLIRVSYLYEFMTPWIGEIFTDYPNNTRLMMSTVVLQTEPYEF